MGFPIISTVLALPLLAALASCFFSREEGKKVRTLAAGALWIDLGLTLYMFFNYNIYTGGMQFTEKIPWITDLGVAYSVGVDGISMPLLLLANAIGLAAIYESWNTEKRTKEFFILLLILITAVMGTFVSRDIFMFLICYEGGIIPIYILVLIWGSTKRVSKEYAGLKLTLYLLIGSGFMLVGIVYIYLTAFPHSMRTFDMEALMAASAMGVFSEEFQITAFLLLAMAFAPLLSMCPFHNWSPDGHAGAPPAVSMIHAGLLKKIGVYGLLRIGFMILPYGAKFWSPALAFCAMLSVVYAAYIAMVQKDLKYIIGYSSVSHMGYILLGFSALNVVSVSGAVGNMVAHGMMSALFFSQIGYIYEKTHLRSIPEICGLAHQMPKVTVGFMLAGMASVGLPGLISFVPEVTIFMGTIGVYPVFAVAAIAGIIFTALYVLRMLAKVLFGPRSERFDHYPDETGADMLPLLILGTFIVCFGIFPQLIFGLIGSGVEPLAPIFERIADAPTLLGGVRW